MCSASYQNTKNVLQAKTVTTVVSLCASAYCTASLALGSNCTVQSEKRAFSSLSTPAQNVAASSVLRQRVSA